MKIPVKLSYQDFRNLTTHEKKKELMKYLTETTLQIEINRNIENGRVPRFSKDINSESLCYLLIAEDIFEFDDTPKCIFCGKQIKKKQKRATFPEKSTVCSKICYDNYKAKKASELNQRTGVKLQKTKDILEEWGSRDPFRGVAPPEITFDQEEKGSTRNFSFKWKIVIPDILDVFYWPLQKKKMTELLLNYSEFNNVNNQAKEAS